MCCVVLYCVLMWVLFEKHIATLAGLPPTTTSISWAGWIAMEMGQYNMETTFHHFRKHHIKGYVYMCTPAIANFSMTMCSLSLSLSHSVYLSLPPSYPFPIPLPQVRSYFLISSPSFSFFPCIGEGVYFIGRAHATQRWPPVHSWAHLNCSNCQEASSDGCYKVVLCEYKHTHVSTLPRPSW